MVIREMTRELTAALPGLHAPPAAEARPWFGNGEPALMPVSIWDYTDYRVFLRESFSAAKAMGNPVSNRWLAKRLGFKSFSFITMLLQGKRNLTRPNREKFARLLGLNAEESDYFAALVDYNQARSEEDRERAMRGLAMLQRPGNRRSISGLNLSATDEGYRRIRELMAEFLERAEALAQLGDGEAREYRFNVQFFPLTPTLRENESMAAAEAGADDILAG